MFSRTRLTVAAAPWQRLRRFATTKHPSSRSKISGAGENNQRPGASASSAEGTCSFPPGQSSGDTRKVVRRKSRESASSETKRRFERAQREDWEKAHRAEYLYPHSAPKALPVIQPSIYYYCTQGAHPHGLDSEGKSSSGVLSSRLALPAMNASALLDPLKYCKASSRLSQNRAGVSRSISGTHAARRLLRGKKDFIVAARSLKTQPALLEGHGVPQKLFQHCVDMADALLLQYSPDVVECTFHNYNYVTGESKLPHILRIRR